MLLEVRPFNFSDADYAQYVQLSNQVHPEHLQTVSQVRHLDQTLGPGEHLGRFLVLAQQEVVGWLSYESPRNPVQGLLEVGYCLLPQYQEHLLWLWGFLLEQMAPLKPRVLLAKAREDWRENVFLRSQGFVEQDRMWSSVLDLDSFDETPLLRSLPPHLYLGRLAQLDLNNLQVQRQYYQLTISLLADVPAAEPIVPWSFELWQERALGDPHFYPAGHFLAFDTRQPVANPWGLMVGVSQLWLSQRPQHLQTGLTGVLPQYRRQGLAQTLKLEAARHAKAMGVRYLRTSNHSINRPMLAINEAMGFAKEPAWINLRKDLL